MEFNQTSSSDWNFHCKAVLSRYTTIQDTIWFGSVLGFFPSLPSERSIFFPPQFWSGLISDYLRGMNFRSMEEFWLFYMNQHSKPATRRWHFVGTLCSIICLIYSMLFNWWFVILVPLLGYGLAWYSHFFVEGNVPATFGHPFWSLLCDFKMFGLMLTGQMDREIKRLGKRPVLQVY